MKKSRGDRHVRVAERIREEISLILQNRVKDPGVVRITVTDVTLTGDLRMARVFYSVLGDPEARKAARDALRRSKGYIRKELGRALQIRYSPDLTFLYDASYEKGVRIERLLRESGSREDDVAK